MDQWGPLIPILVAITSVISAVILYGFTTGKWVQKQELSHQHGESRFEKLEAALAQETAARHALTERVNTDLGRLEQRGVWLEKMIERQEAQVTRRLDRLEERD